jgi:hypothetical protein
MPAYQFDLTDFTRQVVVNRARILLPLIRRAYDRRDDAQFGSLTARWLELMDLADQVEGTQAALMLGPHLDNARANGSTPEEQAHLVRNALNLITNWGTRAGYDAGLRDYANRDWNCFTATYYKARWARFFQALDQQLGSSATPAIDWYQMGEDFANGAHTDCASTPNGDIVQIAQQARAVLDAGPEASVVPDGWSSYAENDAVFGFDGVDYTINSAGADLWQNVNRFGALYRRAAMRDGITVTVHLNSWASEGNRPWARAGLMVGSDLVDATPGGFANIAITPANGCVFSWAPDPTAGLTSYTSSSTIVGPAWVRLSRVGDTYVGACSADGAHWTIVGSAAPGGLGASADVGMFATAANGGGSDRAFAAFDQWQITDAGPSGDSALGVEYFESQFNHYFLTAITGEIAALDAGVFPGWARTGLGFKVHTTSAAGRVPVCRFFTTAFPPTSSHFYAPRGLGCEGALANPAWLYEGEVFYSALPDASGACPAGDIPIYRLYNNGQGGAPNHRFTIDPAVRAQMIGNGYIPEGTGIGVGMCAAS